MENELKALPEEVDLTKIDEAFSAEMPQEREIDVTFFSHKHRKSTQLIGSQAGEPLRGRREWVEYDLLVPVYVSSIRVTASGYSEFHEMELVLEDSLTATKSKITAKFDGAGFGFSPKCFVKSFSIRPDSSWSVLNSPYISRIDVRGLEQNSFFEVVSLYENAAREREKIEGALSEYLQRAKRSSDELRANEIRIKDQKAEVELYQAQISELKSESETLSSQNENLSKRLERGESIERERKERITTIELSIREMTQKRKELSDRIVAEGMELKRIKDEINLFPTEIAGYVSQGGRNIKLYSYLCIIPSLVILVVTYKLFHNSERLLSLSLSANATEVVTFLVSRSPYVAVSAAVLAVCYAALSVLIEEIVNINRKRQELFKISIIATDVSYASQHGLKLKEHEVYDLRTQTKMELLKEHLKMNLNEDFIYDPKKNFIERIKIFSPKVGQ